MPVLDHPADLVGSLGPAAIAQRVVRDEPKFSGPEDGSNNVERDNERGDVG